MRHQSTSVPERRASESAIMGGTGTRSAIPPADTVERPQYRLARSRDRRDDCREGRGTQQEADQFSAAGAQTPSGPAAQDFSSCRGGFPSGRTARRGGGGIGAWHRAVGLETPALLAKIFL